MPTTCFGERSNPSELRPDVIRSAASRFIVPHVWLLGWVHGNDPMHSRSTGVCQTDFRESADVQDTPTCFAYEPYRGGLATCLADDGGGRAFVVAADQRSNRNRRRNDLTRWAAPGWCGGLGHGRLGGKCRGEMFVAVCHPQSVRRMPAPRRCSRRPTRQRPISGCCLPG